MNYDTVENNEQITILPDSEWQGVIEENDYSLEEKLIGKWQGKPLYRRCYPAKTPPEINKVTTVLTIPNKDEIFEVHKLGLYTTNKELGYSYNLGYESPSKNTSGAYYYNSTGKLNMWVGASDWIDNDITIILEYTKKADQ